MKHFELKGRVRTAGGESAIKAIRREGLVQCNLYGNGVNNVIFTVSEKDLMGITHNPASFIIDIVLDNGEKHTAIVHELQYHPVKDNCLHADFLAVSEDKPIAINVPIRVTGHAIGVQAGGRFFQLERKLRISALMKDLPDEIVIDITKLKIGKQIVAGDIKQDKVTILTAKSTILCTVRSTRQMSAQTEEESEEGEKKEGE